MSKKTIDLSDIKENDLDKTSSFTDLMTRKEKKNRTKEKNNFDDIEEMISEKKKSTKDLTSELEKAKNEYNNEIKKELVDYKKLDDENKEENFGKTQILELTRQMKFNFEEKKEENNKDKKKGISILNVIGEINLLCIGYYIYLLVFTGYQNQQQDYLVCGGFVVLLVLLFGLSVITGKKTSKIFNALNILAIIGFIAFNAYTLI